MNSTGISIITCSIKPELCNQMLESVKNTISTDYETIVFDNREKKLGICKVYNHCAQEAKFPYLCFIHEDVIMPTPHWGTNMISFAEKTPDCGIIGFAGGTVAMRNFISWYCGKKSRYRFYDPHRGDNSSSTDLHYNYQNPDNEDFAKAVTIDGVFLFVRKEIWEQNPFDEEKIKGFHFYDADFSFTIAQKWQNYVCLTEDICHFSHGNYEKGYYEHARIFQKIWKHKLPRLAGEQKITLTDEIIEAKEFLVQSVKHKMGIRASIKHLLEINGWWFFFLFGVSSSIKIIYKIIVPKKIRNMKKNRIENK
jgi:hypothetical protein